MRPLELTWIIIINQRCGIERKHILNLNIRVQSVCHHPFLLHSTLTSLSIWHVCDLPSRILPTHAHTDRMGCCNHMHANQREWNSNHIWTRFKEHLCKSISNNTADTHPHISNCLCCHITKCSFLSRHSKSLRLGINHSLSLSMLVENRTVERVKLLSL